MNHFISIVVCFILACLVFFFSGCGVNNENDDSTKNSYTSEKSTNEQNEESTTEPMSLESSIHSFVKSFNSKSNVELVFVDDFSVQDKSSGHYRTEFRLSSYSESVGKSYKYNDNSVDLIARKTLFGEPLIRLYADYISLEDCSAIVASAASFFDPEMTDVDIKEITDYISSNKEANGYYKGNLGILLLASGNNKYDLMLKYEND